VVTDVRSAIRRSPTLRATKREIKQAVKLFRRLTSHVRLLPDFLIVGAQKGGTTSLFRYLAQHPDVVPSSTKEIHFFDLHFERGAAWYRSHFPSRLRRYEDQLRGRVCVTGEASPYYLFHPCAPQRAGQVVPNAKLIVLLRNPIDRAYSHYQHAVRYGYESLSFEQALQAETDRLRDEAEKMMRDPRYASFNHRHFSYLSRGLYVEQLRRWELRFHRGQMLVLRSEDLYDEPNSAFRRVTNFIGVSEWQPEHIVKHNSSSYPSLDPAVRSRLADTFRPHNQALYQYLGTDLGWDG